MNNIALGKYVPYNSFIHRLDPRFKIFAMIVLMVSIFLSFTSIVTNFVVYGLLLILTFTLMKIAHIKILSLFKQLKMMWFMICFLLIINLLVPGDASLGFIEITSSFKIYFSALYNTLYIVLRLIIMLGVSMILTSTTTPLQLTGALEWYMYPLKVIKFPVHEIAMTISLALRFIPTILEETDKIMKAQASRGVDFQRGELKEKVRAIISLIIPLFISAFQRSEDLANAMEARGYNPQAKRTKYRINKWRLRDSLSLVAILSLFSGLIVMIVLKFDFAILFSWVVSLCA